MGRYSTTNPARLARDDGLCAALSLELAQEGVDVEFDRVIADGQAAGDGFVG